MAESFTYRVPGSAGAGACVEKTGTADATAQEVRVYNSTSHLGSFNAKGSSVECDAGSVATKVTNTLSYTNSSVYISTRNCKGCNHNIFGSCAWSTYDTWTTTSSGPLDAPGCMATAPDHGLEDGWTTSTSSSTYTGGDAKTLKVITKVTCCPLK